MVTKEINLKKRVLIGAGSAALFYGLMFMVTGFTTAQDEFPITPPTTPPVTPPSVTLTVTPTATPTLTLTPTPTDENEGHATGGVTAQFGGKTMKVTFNAHGGEDVKGQVSYTDSFGDDFKGDVDVCYEQDENKAVFAGTIEEKNDVTDQYFFIEVQDNGEGSKASPDKIRVNTFSGAPNCAFSGVLPGKVTKGNLQVH